MDSARRTSASMIEELPVTTAESENSKSGGQKQLNSFRIFHFRRKSSWLKELEIRKKFYPKKEGRKIGVLAEYAISG
jgi:hypothetical protein